MDGVERLINRLDEILSEIEKAVKPKCGGKMDTKEKLERVKQNLIQHQHRLMKLEELHRNTHGPHGHVAVISQQGIKRASLESVEIGDTIGGVKIEYESQKDLIRSTGQAIRVISTHMDRRIGIKNGKH